MHIPRCRGSHSSLEYNCLVPLTAVTGSRCASRHLPALREGKQECLDLRKSRALWQGFGSCFSLVAFAVLLEVGGMCRWRRLKMQRKSTGL
jgi:hypothetical protein